MEENLANRSRAELETALLDSSRTLQAILAAQLRSFDGEWDLGLRDRRTPNQCPGGAGGSHLVKGSQRGDGVALWGWVLDLEVPVAEGYLHAGTHEPQSLRPLHPPW